MNSPDPERAQVLREILEGLEMPRSGLRTWLRHNRAFCQAHGGRRAYRELLELIDACERELGPGEPR